MRISQAELNRYRVQIQSRQKESSAYILARLRQEGVKGMGVADAREKTIEIMRDSVGVFGDQAQALSASFFDEMCDAEKMDANPGIMFDDLIDDSMLEDKVHYYAGKLVDGDWDGYVGSNADLAAFYVHKSALDNMLKNCDRNHIRYARVGTGRETCGFCFMLASRGFVYVSDKTAEAGSHHHCDCIIVPGQKGKTKIQGYDPDGMQERFSKVYKAAGGTNAAADAFYRATIEDLDRITGKDQVEKRAHYKTKWISHELEQYDSTWLYRGVKLKDRLKITGPMTEDQAQDYVKTKTQSKHVIADKQENHRGDKAKKYRKSTISISDKEIEELINKYAGTGKVYVTNDVRGGTPQIRESITLPNDKIIGEKVDIATGESVSTNRFTIHYSDKGVHVVPAAPTEDIRRRKQNVKN